MPTGRFTRNTHRQLAATSSPPMTGATAPENPPTAVQARTALGRAFGPVGGQHQAQGGGSKQSRPCRLDQPEGDEHARAGRSGTPSRGCGEDGHADKEAPVAAVAVGQTPEKDEERRVGDGVAVQHPRQLSQVRRPQVPGDLGERHVDDEQVEAGQDRPAETMTRTSLEDPGCDGADETEAEDGVGRA